VLERAKPRKVEIQKSADTHKARWTTYRRRAVMVRNTPFHNLTMTAAP
jgi:hypothetical protein